MSEITPEKTHKLLEKLVEHVMNNGPAKGEVPSKAEFQCLAVKVDSIEGKLGSLEVKVFSLGTTIGSVEDKVSSLEGKIDTLIDGLDGQAQQLDNIRTDQMAFHHSFDRLEKRVENLESAS
jgi:chromosome segregation ATPase